jgi:uncharacterized membrane protein (DUF4010 family)
MHLVTELPWLEFALALAIGALIGVEREQRKRAEAIGSGLRTFILVSEAGAISAWLSGSPQTPWIFLGAGALVAAIVVAGYWAESRARPESLGKTTEVAVLVVYLLGGTVVFGHPGLAVALAIATSAVLAFKEPLHGIVDRIGRKELHAALKLLIATFIVLPVLPDRPIDPFGAINPYSLWWLVILISSLSFAGYIASRWLGPRRGLGVTGLFGGLASSTAVTLDFARTSREKARAPLADALAGGLLLAWAVMFARIAVLVAVVHRSLLTSLWIPLALMGLVTVAAALRFILLGTRDTHGATHESEVRLVNPFSLTASIRFALLFAAVLFVVAIARQHLAGAGLYGVAALAGLTDVDAITLSMAGLAHGGGDARVAAGSIVVAALANTVVKCALVGTLGSRELRRRVWIVGAAVLFCGAVAFVTM